jgi:hypothetical protein
MMFDRVVIINLDRRPDRWRKIRAALKGWIRWTDWRDAWPSPQRFAAYEGPPPEWFSHTAGSWGCLVSHLRVLDQAIRDGLESVLILEDDAHFPPDFGERYRHFCAAVPDDWEALYLGGYHYLPAGWPQPINDEILQGRCVLGTWAYAVRGRAIRALSRAIELYPRILTEDKFGVDRLWGVLHRDGIIRVYTAWRWLVHHGGGRSDTNGRTYRTHTFDMADEVYNQLRQQLPQEVLV